MKAGASGESPNTTILDGVSMKDRMEDYAADHTLPPINWASPYSNASGSSVDDDPVNSVIVRRLSGSSIYARGPRKPMTDPKAARLLHHYIDNLASWVREMCYFLYFQVQIFGLYSIDRYPPTFDHW